MKFLKRIKHIFNHFGDVVIKEVKNDLIIKDKTNKRNYVIADGKDLGGKVSSCEKGRIKIQTLSQYKEALYDGENNLDLSELRFRSGDDIQQLNLENLGLNIHLRDVFVPFDGCAMVGNCIIPRWGHTGDVFMHLYGTNLKGNHVSGDLSSFDRHNRSSVYIWYSEDTFDNDYKKKYPKFFLDDSAPVELKDKYYNPLQKEGVSKNLFAPEGKKVTYYVRQSLTFDEYMNYYEYLNDKYIGNFNISKEDELKIDLIRKFGLDKSKEIVLKLDNYPIPLDVCLNLLKDLSDNEIDSFFSKEDKEKELMVNEIDKVKEYIHR